MSDVIFLSIGFVAGVLITKAFAEEVESAMARFFTKIAAKVGPKN